MPTPFYLSGAQLVTPDADIENAALLIEGARIAAVGAPPPANARLINASEFIVAPGFIDLQCNGGFGLDFTADPTTIWRVAQQLPRYGVTAFLPTIITSPLGTVQCAQDILRAGAAQNWRGAIPLGLHLEGPFLNPAKRGAHNPAYLRLPDLNATREWSPENHVRLVTLAPELDGAAELIRALRARNIVVSAGHSMATFDEAMRGIDAGITYGTHLFNAMPPVDQRAPGLAIALLNDARVTVGIIPDGIHVHPALVALALKHKSPGQLNVVTDAMAALGMTPGEYALGDFRVTVDETSARLADGRLAGSILGMDAALRNLIAFTSCSLRDALATLTTTPARVLHLENERGRIAPGYFADLILLTKTLRLAATMAQGQWVWHDAGVIAL